VLNDTRINSRMLKADLENWTAHPEQPYKYFWLETNHNTASKLLSLPSPSTSRGSGRSRQTSKIKLWYSQKQSLLIASPAGRGVRTLDHLEDCHIFFFLRTSRARILSCLISLNIIGIETIRHLIQIQALTEGENSHTLLISPKKKSTTKKLVKVHIQSSVFLYKVGKPC